MWYINIQINIMGLLSVSICIIRIRMGGKFMERDKALSTDGFIITQRLMKGFQYGSISSDMNGCGWIAAYNLFRGLGYSYNYEQVYEEMNKILPYKGMLGTPTKTLRNYIKSKNISITNTIWKKPTIKASKQCKVGIIRYLEGFEPHYVTFLRIDEDKFRFLNAKEGKEDYILTMEQFIKIHCWFPLVRTMMVM